MDIQLHQHEVVNNLSRLLYFILCDYAYIWQKRCIIRKPYWSTQLKFKLYLDIQNLYTCFLQWDRRKKNPCFLCYWGIFFQTCSKTSVFQPLSKHSRLSTICIFIAFCTFILREFFGIIDHIGRMPSQVVPYRRPLDDWCNEW